MSNRLKRPSVYKFLLPFSWIYQVAVIFRNWCFEKGWLHTRSFDIPVISVGNITVGGTGKTPHTEYLIRLLSNQFKLAVLSRGYKRKSKGFVLAQDGITIEDIGDEPYQMWTKFPQINVAVDRDRCHGIDSLLDLEEVEKEVIVLDDAYQHRYVKPGLSILLIDYNRPIFYDAMLPAGRLREPAQEKRRADIIIVSKCPETMTEQDRADWLRVIAPDCGQQVFFTSFKYHHLQNVFHPEISVPLGDNLAEMHLLLLTGIASPAPIIRKLSEYTSHIIPLTFPDHHLFTESEMKHVAEVYGKLPKGKRLIVTTDKDAVRLLHHPGMEEELKPYLFTLPIEVFFLDGQELLFNQNIIEYVRKNSRNSSLLKG